MVPQDQYGSRLSSSAYYTATPLDYGQFKQKIYAYIVPITGNLVKSQRWEELRHFNETGQLPGHESLSDDAISIFLMGSIRPQFKLFEKYVRQPEMVYNPMGFLAKMSLDELKRLRTNIESVLTTPPFPGANEASYRRSTLPAKSSFQGQNIPEDEWLYLKAYADYVNEYVYGDKLMRIAMVITGKRPVWYKGKLSFQDYPGTSGYPFIEEVLEKKIYEKEKADQERRLREEREKSEAAWNKYLADALSFVEQKFNITRETVESIYADKMKLMRQRIAEEILREKLSLERKATASIAAYDTAFKALEAEERAKKALLETVHENQGQMRSEDVREAVLAVMVPDAYERATRGHERLVSGAADRDERPFLLKLAEGQISPEKIAGLLDVLGRPQESMTRRTLVDRLAKTTVEVEKKAGKKATRARAIVEGLARIPMSWQKLPEIIRRGKK
jgi:hypothetical protein